MDNNFTFSHLDPDGTHNPYSPQQNAAICRAILQKPLGGTLRLPGHEDRFEVRWGRQASSWKTAITFCSDPESGIYQVNVSWNPLETGNTRDVQVTEVDSWMDAVQRATDQLINSRPCRYGARCDNHTAEHRMHFSHPGAAGPSLARTASGRDPRHTVQLVASTLGGISYATAYHTSVLVDGQEFSFSNTGINVFQGPRSHPGPPDMGSPVILDMGFSTESGPRLFDALKAHFRVGTYDLLNKNCNSFSDVALYFLLQKRLSLKYKVLERCGRHLPGLIAKITGGQYQPNPEAARFDPEKVRRALDTPDGCVTPGCSKPTWNGQPGQRCSRSCGSSAPSHGYAAGHSAVAPGVSCGGAGCSTPGCGKPSWNGQLGERCTRSCGKRMSF